MNRFLFCVFFTLWSALAGAGAKEIFNGKDLTGWDGDPRLWHVENGTIVGETDSEDRALESNSFLIWKGGEVKDFDFKVKARVTGNNSGIQYRGQRINADEWRVTGYQMDMHPNQPYLGMLYEEGGRQIICQRGQRVRLSAAADPEELGRIPIEEVDVSKWNDYRVVARGNRLRHYVNGELAAEVIDNDRAKRSLSGVLALQLHAGPAMRAEFKELSLTKAESGKADSEKNPPQGNPTRTDEPFKASDSELPKDVTERFTVKPGFRLEKVYQVKPAEGSWISITEDDEGRLICSDQYGGIYRVTLSKQAEPLVERVPLSIGGAHGLLWFEDALYITVNEWKDASPGVYRAVDTDGDGLPDSSTLLRALASRGEHGPHSLTPSPDGNWLYLVAGNHTTLPEIDSSLVPRIWGEDQLLPRRPDARGHARDQMAPGGWVVRFRPDGSNWQLVTVGLRNAYDLAFNAHGDLFTYDADMEWDMGMPWYRPTRICQVLPGAEFGWRNGTGKWPNYYEDSMPPTLEIGPGSPTGLLSGKGAKFPPKYQQALFALDWTYATIHAIHLTPDGVQYQGEREELLSGSGMPFADAEIGQDGAMYLLTGGRKTDSALWRLSYQGEENTRPTANQPGDDPPRQGIGFDLQTAQISPDVENILPKLGSTVRPERFLARTALERAGEEAALKASRSAESDWAKLQSLMALARLNAAGNRATVFEGLDKIKWNSLRKPQQLAWLRTMSLLFIRDEEPTPAEREKLLRQIDGEFPAEDDDLNRELCRMLSYVKAPNVVSRTLDLMDTAPPPKAPEWLELASRNDSYGHYVTTMIANLPSPQVIHYVYCLRVVDGPWERSERERFFTWLNRLEGKSGGASYGGFLRDLRAQTIANATPKERVWLEEFTPEQHDPLADLPQVEGPGKAWTVDEIVALELGKDREHGEKMFRAVLCAACHSINGRGGAAGPDLSTLSGRFTVKDLAESMLHPSKEISDQYNFDVITLKNGQSGR
jgi:cytochrome c553